MFQSRVLLPEQITSFRHIVTNFSNFQRSQSTLPVTDLNDTQRGSTGKPACFSAPSCKAQAGERVGQPHRLVHWVSHGLGTTNKAGPFSNCGSDENPGKNMAFIFQSVAKPWPEAVTGHMLCQYQRIHSYSAFKYRPPRPSHFLANFCLITG